MQYIINDKHIRGKNEHCLTCPVPSDTYMYREEVILGSLKEMFHHLWLNVINCYIKEEVRGIGFLYALLDLFYFFKKT